MALEKMNGHGSNNVATTSGATTTTTNLPDDDSDVWPGEISAGNYTTSPRPSTPTSPPSKGKSPRSRSRKKQLFADENQQGQSSISTFEISDYKSNGSSSSTQNGNNGEYTAAWAETIGGKDIEFKYSDTDTYKAEMAELYSYNEQEQFFENQLAFQKIMSTWNLSALWKPLDDKIKVSIVQKLLNQLDLCDATARMDAAKAILYLAQGCWSEARRTLDEHENMVRENVTLLTTNGTFAAVTELLNLELESAKPSGKNISTFLNILYTIIETIRTSKPSEETQQLQQLLISQLNEPVNKYDVLLLVKLFHLIAAFVEGGGILFIPIKKVLLLTWKIMLLTLGDNEAMKRKRNELRAVVGLPATTQDTLEIANTIRTLQAGVEDARKAKSGSHLRVSRNPERDRQDCSEALARPSVIREGLEFGNLRPRASASTSTHRNTPWIPKTRLADLDTFLSAARTKYIGVDFPGDRVTVAGLPTYIVEGVSVLKQYLYESLGDWQMEREKVLEKTPISAGEHEVEERTRTSPMGILYQALLPHLNHYIVAFMKIMLQAVQIENNTNNSDNKKKETLSTRNTNGNASDGNDSESEIKTFEEVEREKSQKPKSRPKLNILGETAAGAGTTPPEANLKTTGAIDVERHKEILIKSISAILLLLLKHTKLTHIYQFECITQHLVFTNCIPLILKYFTIERVNHVVAGGLSLEVKTASGSYTIDGKSLEYPGCVFVFAQGPKYRRRKIDYSPRNLYTSINLVRVLNKLCKWKPSRIAILKSLKIGEILRNILKVRHAILQIYILKLMKMHVGCCGRPRTPGHLSCVTVIYQKIRARLNDGWVYENLLKSGSGGGATATTATAEDGGGGGGGWEEDEAASLGTKLAKDECVLRRAIELYHLRRFGVYVPKVVWKSGSGQPAAVAAAATGESKLQREENINQPQIKPKSIIPSASGSRGEENVNQNQIKPKSITPSVSGSRGEENVNQNQIKPKKAASPIPSGSRSSCPRVSHSSRSTRPAPDFNFTPTSPDEYNIDHILSRPYELAPTFKENYEKWLEEQVFQNPINWDQVMKGTNGLL